MEYSTFKNQEKLKNIFSSLFLRIFVLGLRYMRGYSVVTTSVESPDEIYDSYVEFNDQLELDTNIYNSLNQKASS